MNLRAEHGKSSRRFRWTKPGRTGVRSAAIGPAANELAERRFRRSAVSPARWAVGLATGRKRGVRTPSVAAAHSKTPHTNGGEYARAAIVAGTVPDSDYEVSSWGIEI